ncbi:hypothetical protein HDU96_006300 [Phlyctochytrium bullatum]|nr:hypothetical protein HDU96_006300 [Phlyctochytrium bullatum]
MQQLKFRHQIASKKATPEKQLKWLKELHGKLAKLENKDFDFTSLSEIRDDLISHALLRHKDSAIRLHVACCLADVLRLFATTDDRPYPPSVLIVSSSFVMECNITFINNKDVIKYILTEFREPTASAKHQFLGERILAFKALLLESSPCDVQSLVAYIFESFYAILNDNTAKGVFLVLIDILEQLVNNCPALDNNVLELLLALKLHVQQYFNKELESARERGDWESISLNLNGVQELNSQIPGIFREGIPFLEEELEVEKISLPVAPKGKEAEQPSVEAVQHEGSPESPNHQEDEDVAPNTVKKKAKKQVRATVALAAQITQHKVRKGRRKGQKERLERLCQQELKRKQKEDVSEELQR